MRSVLHIFLTLLFIALGTMAAQAQKERIVEQSRKPRPTWVGLSTSDYLAVTEVGQSISEATEKAMSSVRQHIINSIAVNVSSSEIMISRQVNCNDLSKVMQDYNSVLMTEAAKLPYLSDISVSNAVDIYWERIYSRATKSYRYELSVRYPFNEDTRRELIEAFIAIDNAKVAELEQLERELESIDDMDKVKDAVYTLEALSNYFFDSVRRDEAEALRRSYRALYSRLTIQIEEQGEGYCIYSLRIGERRVTTSVGARLRSDAAVEMMVQALDGKRYKLSYNAEYASPKDINSIDITYPFGGVSITETIYFDAPVQR